MSQDLKYQLHLNPLKYKYRLCSVLRSKPLPKSDHMVARRLNRFHFEHAGDALRANSEAPVHSSSKCQTLPRGTLARPQLPSRTFAKLDIIVHVRRYSQFSRLAGKRLVDVLGCSHSIQLYPHRGFGGAVSLRSTHHCKATAAEAF